MAPVLTKIKARNWVAKNNFNRPARHRDTTQYQRQPKHRSRSSDE